MPARLSCSVFPILIAGSPRPVMEDPLPTGGTLDEAGRIYQEVVDLLLFLSDEIEMGRIPRRNDGVGALRMAAGLVALSKKLS
jgi:hypothetical protein